MTNEKTERTIATSSFRTTEDAERTRRAGAIVARMQAAVEDAEKAAADAEAVCVETPDAKGAFEKARSARKAVDDAARDLALAHAHAAKIEAEIAAAERRAIEAEITRREKSLTAIVDGEAEERGVELALLAIGLRRELEDRISRRRAELVELNGLRARIGAEQTKAPDPDSLLSEALQKLAEIGLAAQARVGVRAESVWAGGVGICFPMWREAHGVREYVTGREEFWVSGATADGTPITHGRLTTHIVERAAELVERVGARVNAPHGAGGGTALKAAAVVGLGVVAALALAQG